MNAYQLGKEAAWCGPRSFVKLLFESEAQRGQISFQILVQDPTDLNFKSKNNDRKEVTKSDVLSQKLQLTKLRNVSWFRNYFIIIMILSTSEHECYTLLGLHMAHTMIWDDLIITIFSWEDLNENKTFLWNSFRSSSQPIA